MIIIHMIEEGISKALIPNMEIIFLIVEEWLASLLILSNIDKRIAKLDNTIK